MEVYKSQNVTGSAIIDHLSTKIMDCYRPYSNNYLYYHNKIITTAEFKGLSSEAYRNGILYT